MFGWLKNSWKKLAATLIASTITGVLLKTGMAPETVQNIVHAITVLILGLGAADAGKTGALIEKGLAAPPWWLKAVYAAVAAVLPFAGPILGLSAALIAMLVELFLGLAGAQALADWKASKTKMLLK